MELLSTAVETPHDALSEYFSEHRTSEGHGQRSVRGGAVSLVARAINAFIQIGSVLFLARLLTPEDYGLVGMVLAITGYATAQIDLGTRDAIVQRPKITEGEISALFWITIAIGTGFSLIISAAGPLIARFYHEPRLTMITMVSSLTFITGALTCQHYALLRRAMHFRDLGVIEVIANVLSAAIAVFVAFSGYHYWALVVRPIAVNVLLAGGLWLRCRWTPGKPDYTTGVKEMVKFGLHLGGFTFSDYVGKSVDKVAIGRNSGPKALGYYQNASFIYENLMGILVLPLHSVAVSSLSKVQSDTAQFRRLWSKALSTLTFYATPAFGLLAVTSKDIVVILLGQKWVNAGIILSILALRGMPHSIERTLGWLHVSAGRSDRWMRYGIVAALAHIIALAVGFPFGVMGIVTAYVIVMFILFIPALAYAGKPMNIGAKEVINVVWRQLFSSLLATAVVFALRNLLFGSFSPILRTVCLISLYCIIYLLSVMVLLRVRTPVSVVLRLVRDILPARFRRFVKIPAFMESDGYEQI